MIPPADMVYLNQLGNLSASSFTMKSKKYVPQKIQRQRQKYAAIPAQTAHIFFLNATVFPSFFVSKPNRI